jgi:hypothetical protein
MQIMQHPREWFDLFYEYKEAEQSESTYPSDSIQPLIELEGRRVTTHIRSMTWKEGERPHTHTHLQIHGKNIPS